MFDDTFGSSRRRYVPDRLGRLGQGHYVKERDPFGRLPQTNTDKPFDFSNLFGLSDSVGEGAENSRNDVAKVETLLDRAKTLDLGQTDGPTGYAGQRMFDGIRKFQKQNGLKVDGRMNPGGPTMDILNGQVSLAGGPDGRVDVDAYTQNRDGDSVSVKSHTRSAPGQGGGLASSGGKEPSTPSIKSPVPNGRVREQDDWGSGQFGARRTKSDGKTYPHEGVDIITKPGEMVVSPVDGTYVSPWGPYTKDPNYSGVKITTGDGTDVRVYYVDPSSDLKPGDKVEAGKTPIGTAQNIAKKYPPTKDKGPMTNHVHIQAQKDGKFIDLTGGLIGKK